MMKEKQTELLGLMKKFDVFARENRIKYFAMSGTCLGAVRENGFIPWDGDIDIAIPVDDYKKCEELLKGDKSENFVWLSYKSDSKAPNLMGRIYEKNVRIENLEDYAYIDVFAVVGVPNGKLKQSIFMVISLYVYRIYWIKHRFYKNSLNRKKSKIGLLLQLLLFLFPSFICRIIFERQLTMFKYSKSDYVAGLTGLYGQKEVLPKKWFEEEQVYMDFCDMKLPVFKDWDSYLRHMYGDNYNVPIRYGRFK